MGIQEGEREEHSSAKAQRGKGKFRVHLWTAVVPFDWSGSEQ